MKNVMTNISRDLCTGCGACENICPVDAITMEPDKEGFIMPIVDSNKCVDCGKCVKICPLTAFEKRNSAKPEVYAAMADDQIRKVSSSGGMFTLLADEIFKSGGAVCGAAYDENWLVKHIIIDKPEDISKIRGSKYVQSNTGTIFRDVKKILDDGRKVLFTGCPCQVAGLYSFLQKDYPNLYTADLLCHGVPSPKVFDKYLNETFGERRKNITRIDFRDKSVFGWSSSINISFSDGTEYRCSNADDPYYRAFLPIISLRRSCAHCKFSPVPRVGDISIGDFWGISRYKASLNDQKGTSLVIVNSEKGRQIFNAIKERIAVCEEVPIDVAISGNATLAHPFRSHPARGRFFRDLELKPLKELVDKAKRFYYDIGIVGLWYGLNYGSVLTYYALYETVRSMGYDAILINKPDFLWTPRYAERDTVANKFMYKQCNVSNIRKGKYGWLDMNNFCDTFIVGSDVVWNYQICGKEAGQFFFLDFVNDSKKKIAMASSFGAGYDAPDDERLLSKYYLEKFDYIGVREEDAVSVCQTQFGIKPDLVIDPVFLCGKEIYNGLVESAEHKESEPFITSYILGPDPVKASILNKISGILGLPLRNIPNPNAPETFEPATKLTALKNQSIEDWLYHVKESDFFVGDSFHGLCFSLIFEKQFIIILNSNVSGLCRFTTLLKMVGLENRLLFTDKGNFDEKIEQLLNEKIDFSGVRKILDSKCQKSRKWLLNALESHKTKRSEARDLIISKLYEQIGKLEASNQNMQSRLSELEKGKKDGN